MASAIEWPAFDETGNLLEQLAALSRYYGSDPDIVLAGGGNTSVKDGGRLWVKASGVALARVVTDGFVEMDRKRIASLLAEEPLAEVNAREARFKEAVMGARIHPERGQRPSVEAALHHLLPSRFVVHSHATLVNAITCCAEGEGLAREMFGDDVLWVEYVDPGDTLARLVQAKLADHVAGSRRPGPKAIFMESHGLIVGGESPDEVRAATDAILGKIAERLAAAPPAEGLSPTERIEGADAQHLINTVGPALRGLLAEGGALKVVAFDDSEVAMRVVASEDGPEMANGGPLTPDQIVYCKSFPLVFTPWIGELGPETVERLRGAVAEHTESTGFAPKVVLVLGLGLFAAGDDFAAADTVRQVYLDAVKVMAAAKRLGGVRHMRRRDREFIDNWEVESYRRQVAAGAKKAGRAAGKVAVVTGAAQGFGRGIVDDLCAEGAHVILADINADGVGAAADALCGQYGAGRAMGVVMNVTDGMSVADALHRVVRAYGGFDVFVSNAGVLRAGSVVKQPVSEFEFVTKVNYTGYFVCVQNAAPIMAVQRQARPDVWGDIIQINSKSGLAGSNRNGAYAGAKFGGIGLTQSFALELIEDGIKVNAICPGNFFEGPLWSDPEGGLFAQYLRAGKVPGAETIADVKRFYEAKVPMGRGCTVVDVMRALYYIVEQEYETGQAIPVTGGQVMLS